MRTYSTSEIAGMVGIHPNTVMLYEKWATWLLLKEKKMATGFIPKHI
jgi:hypothetical protein